MSNTYSHMFVCTYYGPVSPFFPSAGHEPLPLRHWTVCFSSPKRWQRAAACTCLHFLGRFEFGENPGNDFDMVWEVPLFKTNPYTVYIYAWLFTVCLSLSTFYWVAMGGITCLLPQTGVYLQNTHNIRNHVASIWNADILLLELNPVQHRVWEFLSMLDTLSCLRPFLRNNDTLEPMSSSQNPRYFYLLSLLMRFSYWYRNELYKSSH